MAAITLDQLLKELDRKEKVVNAGVPFKFGVFDVTALMHKRIFTDGLDSGESKIGSYDTKRELWVDDSRLRKAGNHKGKTGNTIKTSYYANYKALRSQQGVESNFVNLKFTDELQLDFGAIPTRINDLQYRIQLNKEINSNKFRGAEKRFDTTIGDLTSSELDQLKKTIEFELDKLYNA